MQSGMCSSRLTVIPQCVCDARTSRGLLPSGLQHDALCTPPLHTAASAVPLLASQRLWLLQFPFCLAACTMARCPLPNPVTASATLTPPSARIKRSCLLTHCAFATLDTCRVFCPAARTMVHLTPLPAGGIGAADVDVPAAIPATDDERAALEFLGPQLADDVARGIAAGDCSVCARKRACMRACVRACCLGWQVCVRVCVCTCEKKRAAVEFLGPQVVDDVVRGTVAGACMRACMHACI